MTMATDLSEAFRTRGVQSSDESTPSAAVGVLEHRGYPSSAPDNTTSYIPD